jgi:hypothetical protein
MTADRNGRSERMPSAENEPRDDGLLRCCVRTASVFLLLFAIILAVIGGASRAAFLAAAKEPNL